MKNILFFIFCHLADFLYKKGMIDTKTFGLSLVNKGINERIMLCLVDYTPATPFIGPLTKSAEQYIEENKRNWSNRLKKSPKEWAD